MQQAAVRALRREFPAGEGAQKLEAYIQASSWLRASHVTFNHLKRIPPGRSGEPARPPALEPAPPTFCRRQRACQGWRCGSVPRMRAPERLEDDRPATPTHTPSAALVGASIPDDGQSPLCPFRSCQLASLRRLRVAPSGGMVSCCLGPTSSA